MNFLDRRFLNLSLSVNAITNEPAANPAVGTQYIVGSSPTGAFASASANQIARYNGSAWLFFTPKTRELEVLNLDSGEFLQFNGSAWTSVASLSAGSSNPSGANIISIDGIAAGYDNNPSSVYLTPGNFLLDDNHTCYFSVDDDNTVNMYSHTWYSYPVSNGSSFLCWDGYDSYKLYTADNSSNGWHVSDVSEGAIFFNRTDSSIYALLNGNPSKISNGIIVFDGFATSGNSGYHDDTDNLPDNPNQGDIFIPLEYLDDLDYEYEPIIFVADSNNNWEESHFPYWRDTCYVSTNHGYAFRWDGTSENTNERFFCIHHLKYLDILFNLAENKFYRYLNGTFVCINDSSQDSGGSSSEPLAPVLSIIQTASSLPDSCAVGDSLLNTSDAKIYTATAANTWNSGILTTNGARYASSTDHKIYSSNGSALSEVSVPTGGIFLNKDDNFLYVYDGSTFIKASNDSVSVPVFVTESHSLTAAEVTAKSFSLSNSIASGQ